MSASNMLLFIVYCSLSLSQFFRSVGELGPVASMSCDVWKRCANENSSMRKRRKLSWKRQRRQNMHSSYSVPVCINCLNFIAN